MALYESRPGATIAGTAADLDVSPETLRNRIRAARKKRGESARPGPRPRARVRESSGEASPEVVEAENAELRTRRSPRRSGPSMPSMTAPTDRRG
ncbi:transposase [Streptosporangium canum]|uniref:transposase n=1 Tax=Streptosporangium canum TaxID=324952 RepID=UPI003F4D03B5